MCLVWAETPGVPGVSKGKKFSHDGGMRVSDDTERNEQDGQSEGESGEKRRESDTQSSDKKCPECDAPIDNLRASCIECGYEYKKDDYDDPEAGNEYLAGSNIDDEGEEITDEGPGAEEGAE